MRLHEVHNSQQSRVVKPSIGTISMILTLETGQLNRVTHAVSKILSPYRNGSVTAI